MLSYFRDKDDDSIVAPAQNTIRKLIIFLQLFFSAWHCLLYTFIIQNTFNLFITTCPDLKLFNLKLYYYHVTFV